MSQAPTSGFGFPLTGPKTPTAVATQADESLDALLSFHSGSSRPSYAVAGTIWLDTSVAGTHTYKQFDGTDDTVLYSVNTSTGAVTFASGASLTDAVLTDPLLSGSLNGGPLAGVRNKIINPGGVYIQRGSVAIAASSSAYVFDRFLVTNNTNQTVTVSQVQLGLSAGFAAGGERFVMRYAFSSAPTSGTLRVEQRIEDVTSIKAGDWTLTAWMSGPTGAETLSAEAVQHFGTGGSPSSNVTTAMTFAGDSPTTIYDASTNRRCWGVTVPSMSAKVLGTDNNDYLAAAVVLTPRQTGNYDLTWLSFVQGDASNEYDPNGSYRKDDDLPRCQRYFCKSYELNTSPGTSTQVGRHIYIPIDSGAASYSTVYFAALMRALPTVQSYATAGTAGKVTVQGFGEDTASILTPSISCFTIRQLSAIGSGRAYIELQWTANAEFV